MQARKIEKPAVTLADEARIGVEEEVRSGFLDWLMSFSVEGENGKHYELGGSILSMHLEKMDLATMIIKEGYGAYSEQLRGSVYRLCRAPEAGDYGLVFPQSTGNTQTGTPQKQRACHLWKRVFRRVLQG